jgi:hypothetical protein
VLAGVLALVLCRAGVCAGACAGACAGDAINRAAACRVFVMICCRVYVMLWCRVYVIMYDMIRYVRNTIRSRMTGLCALCGIIVCDYVYDTP